MHEDDFEDVRISTVADRDVPALDCKVGYEPFLVCNRLLSAFDCWMRYLQSATYTVVEYCNLSWNGTCCISRAVLCGVGGNGSGRCSGSYAGVLVLRRWRYGSNKTDCTSCEQR